MDNEEKRSRLQKSRKGIYEVIERMGFRRVLRARANYLASSYEAALGKHLADISGTRIIDRHGLDARTRYYRVKFLASYGTDAENELMEKQEGNE